MAAEDANMDIQMEDEEGARAELFGSPAPRKAAAERAPPRSDDAPAASKAAAAAPAPVIKKSTIVTRKEEEEDEEAKRELLSGLKGKQEFEQDADAILSQIDFDSLNLTEEAFVQFEEDDVHRFLENPMVRAALDSGTDLQKYGREVETNLKEVERASIADYVHEKDNFKLLHDQIVECDAVLAKMEVLLGGFQADLGNISSEIKTLQDKSMEMNLKLKNRKAVEWKLSKFVDNVLVPPELITCICEGEIDETFIRRLKELDRKIAFYQSDQKHAAAALEDMGSQLEHLKVKAGTRTREFLLQRMQALKKPKTHISNRQGALLKFKYLYQFVQAHPVTLPIANEVAETYTGIMSKIYATYMKAYLTNMMKLQEDTADQLDTIVPTAPTRRLTDMFKSKKTGPVRNLFKLNGRDNVLSDAQPTAVSAASSATGLTSAAAAAPTGEGPDPEFILHLSAQQNERYPYEYLFKQALVLLMDTASSEYNFNLDFFGKMALTQRIFGETLTAFLNHVEDYAKSSVDCVGMMLCLRVIDRMTKTMQQRRIPVLDPLFNAINMSIWPRMTVTFEAQLDSLKRADARNIGSINVHVHEIVKRAGDFAQSMAVVRHEFTMNAITLDRLRVEIANFIARVGDDSTFRDRRLAMVFQLNNFYHLYSALQVAHESSEFNYFKQQYETISAAYVEEMLLVEFRALIEFTLRVEPLTSQATAEQREAMTRGPELSGVEALARDFSDNWMGKVRSLQRDIMGAFDEPDNALTLLQRLLVQITIYYRRFRAVVDQCWKHPPFIKLLLDEHLLMVGCQRIVKENER